MRLPYRVLIVDDHAHAREGIRDIVLSDSDFEIAGEARNGVQALELTEQLMPDLILMDINMPEMDGLEATKRIKERYPYVKIVILTVSDDIADLFEALKRGAQGYLLKNLDPSEWIEYLKAIVVDEIPMSRKLAVQILGEFKQKERSVPKTNPLSSREREILELVALGRINREIAEILHISENTVKNHLKNILKKLHLENRVQLTSFAYEQGWIQGKKEKDRN